MLLGDSQAGKRSIVRLFKRDTSDKGYDYYTYHDRNGTGIQFYLINGRDNATLLDNVITPDNY